MGAVHKRSRGRWNLLEFLHVLRFVLKTIIRVQYINTIKINDCINSALETLLMRSTSV